MLLVRDVFHCKPGKAGELARRLQQTIPSSEAEDGFRHCRVLVDYVGSYWTVVLEGEVESLTQFDHHMANYAARPAVSEGMFFDRGYPDGILPALGVPERSVPNGTRAGEARGACRAR